MCNFGVIPNRLFIADAALALVAKDPRSYTGQTLTDKEVLRQEGVTEFSKYALPPRG
jgi:hypothetical protein